MFAIENKTSEIYDVVDEESAIDVASQLPSALESLEPLGIENGKIYFIKGIDTTGQEYGIYYYINSETLCLNYDTTSFQEKYNPSLKDYKKFNKILDEYLSSLDVKEDNDVV